MKKLLNKKNLFYLILTVVVWGVLFALSEGRVLSYQMRNMLVPIGVNIILAVSLNLIVGFLGELALGHAGFMAVGAYAGCLLIKTMSGFRQCWRWSSGCWPADWQPQRSVLLSVCRCFVCGATMWRS